VTSDAQPAIRLRGVGKQYTKYEDTPAFVSTLGSLVTRSKRSKLWAVRDLDLDVAPGSCFGVVGANGAGKSTLLQMLCGVTAPSEGRLTVRGRVVPLISVGVGFHPELTGRENVFVNAQILGLNRKQIEQRLDEIVEFSGLEDFIDTPVKFYSSGMYVRLGFSVAVQIDPDVLLIDEVLAVGDMAFQVKCFERLNEVRQSGATVVLVTHNLNVVRRLCDSAILMERGRKVYEGTADGAVSEYLERLRTGEGDADMGYATYKGGKGQIVGVSLLDGSGKASSSLEYGDELNVRVRVEAYEPLDDAYVSLSLHAGDGTLVYRESSYETPWSRIEAGQVAEATLKVAVDLPTGQYSVSVGMHQLPTDRRTKAIQLDASPDTIFHVLGRHLVQGVADLGRGISIETPSAPAKKRSAAPAKKRTASPRKKA
jgi:ABC-2 type transport system ATP-binding protein